MKKKHNAFNKHGPRKSKVQKFRRKKKGDLEKQEITLLEASKAKLDGMNPEEIESFAVLPLSKKTLKGLREAKFTVPTKVQRQSLVFSLQGLDVVAAAKTGSGKTLAFIIPLLEVLYNKQWTQLDGLGALVITPTRELAYQIFEVLNKVGKDHDFSAGLVIGGKDLKYEWNRISSCNIMICTPGRLLQHMTENAEFVIDNVQMLVLDEADQCLSMGFADTMNCILEELPSERQTLLFSATQTRDVKDLIRAGCNNPVFCSVHEHSKTCTPKGLQESYVLCSIQDKFTFLWSFIRHHRKHKILVFLATCKQVQYYYDMLCKLHPGLSVMGLHGSMHQLRRMAVYDEFCQKRNAVLIATDVAARGLDIPAVDWVVQVDCPEDITTYIHRVGRTARYSKSGEAILLLTPSEEPAMLDCLKAKNIPIEKIDVDPSKLQGVNVKMEIVLSKYNNLKEEAVRAFKSYLKNIALMRNKKVFDVTSIDFDAFARSYGLVVTPRVRFIEKQLKQKAGNKAIKPPASSTTQSEPSTSALSSKLTTLDFGADDSDEDDDFLSSAKDQNIYLPPEDSQDSQVAEESQKSESKKKKPLTKYAVVKKLLKKNLQVNKRVVFDEEGEEILDPRTQQVSEAARTEQAEETSGINIAKLKEIMREEDKVDKRLHAVKLKEKNWEKKRKEKEKNAKLRRGGSDDEADMEESDVDEDSNIDDDDTQAIIDDLPDPDEHYGKTGDSAEEEEDEDEEDSEEEEEQPQPKKSLKRRTKEQAREAKRARLAQSNTLESLPVDEQEQLALFLLRNKR